MTDHVETTLPWLTFDVSNVPGSWPGLGRLVIDNDDATNDQWWVAWGIQSRYYSSSSSAALGWQAEALTAMGGSATSAGPTGASGSGSNVMRNTSLGSAYQAILSTQATGGGTHMSHVGSFRVFARVQVPTTNTGTVSVAFEWGEGDFRRYSRNTATAIDPIWEGTWQLIDLGLVSLTKVTSGTQRWEGRVLAKSTVAGDDIDVDWLALFPVDEGYGEVSTPVRLSTPTSFSARDEFDHTAGDLNGKTLPTTGTWSGSTDFDTTGSGTVTRNVISSATIRAGSGTLTNTVVGVDLTLAAALHEGGVIARYVDASNYLTAAMGATGRYVIVRKVIAGSPTTLAFTTSDGVTSGGSFRFDIAITARGDWIAFIDGRIEARGYDAALATGGTLASGGYGLYHNSPAAPFLATFDNFTAYAGVLDAAMFASQSLEVRSDRVVREDSAGALWLTPTAYRGDYLLVPPAGAEGRTTRVMVKASRGVPGEGPDLGTDDISAKLYVTPRYLTVPEP